MNIEKLRKLNIGKVLYKLKKIKDETGVIINTHIDKCIGQIKSIDNDGICILYNPLLKKEVKFNIVELNKDIINRKYILLKKFL